MRFSHMATASALAVAVIAALPAHRVLADVATVPFTVKRGVIIPVRLTKEIRVGGVGDSEIKKVSTMEVAQDVIVDGHIIAKSGDTVDGNMSTQKNVTQRAFSTNTSQELSLDVDDVVNFCGDTLHMKYERTLVGGARAGLASFGAHAHDAVFDRDSILKATTDRVQKGVCSEPTRRPPETLPDNIMLSDEELATPAPASQ